MIRPTKAVKITCRICNGGATGCTSRYCVLLKKGVSLMQRIKQHCITCAPDHKTDDCNGRIIGSQAKMHVAAGCEKGPDDSAICPLFPYRHGKNPNRSRALSETARQKLVEAGAKHRFSK